MRISDTAIRRPVATAMVALALILFGFISIFRMRLDLLSCRIMVAIRQSSNCWHACGYLLNSNIHSNPVYDI